VLRNSKEKEVSLKDELEALKLYLKIEKTRLNNKFDYTIQVESSIHLEKIAFPPLVIQPFVENSIWHGFVNKEGQGNLAIIVRMEEGLLVTEVVDDGIGREASRKIEQSRDRKRSYGITITENRLHNIADSADIKILDLFDESGISAGTKVEIRIPLKIIEHD